MVRAIGVAAVCLVSISGGRIAAGESPGERDARMGWWRDAKFGLFVHWGPVSLTGKELSWSRKGPRPSDHEGLQEIPTAEYDSLYQRFDPSEFDAREWVSVARAAGMKYLVFTSKHHDGFSNFHTRHSEYDIEASPFRRDIVKELAEACREGGLRFGIYYSTRDWYHPDYLVGDNSRYNDFYHGQIRELLSSYGRVDVLWFDHVGGKWKDWRFGDLFGMIHELQPKVIVNNRAAAFVHSPPDAPPAGVADLVRGDFDTPEQTIGHFQIDRDWESCITLVGGQWSYQPGGKMLPREECIRTLVQCVTGGGNLLLNVGPMPTGRIEPRQVERLKEIGAWLEKYGESVHGTRGGPWRNGAWGGSTRRDRTIWLHILAWDGDAVTLPAIDRKIAGHACLTGGTAAIVQDEKGVRVSLPAASRDPVDTIIRLELDGPAG